jgi:hypothetical protein
MTQVTTSHTRTLLGQHFVSLLITYLDLLSALFTEDTLATMKIGGYFMNTKDEGDSTILVSHTIRLILIPSRGILPSSNGPTECNYPSSQAQLRLLNSSFTT